MLVIVLSGFLALSCNPDNFQNPESNFTYFMVAEYPSAIRGDSYVLPLDKPADIEIARSIIENPNNVSDKIIVARIERQLPDKFIKNKDLQRNITWSWHVTEFMGFAGSTIELLDGNPSMVEEDLDLWFQNTANSSDHGTIGFWGYTLVKEVSTEELR